MYTDSCQINVVCAHLISPVSAVLNVDISAVIRELHVSVQVAKVIVVGFMKDLHIAGTAFRAGDTCTACFKGIDTGSGRDPLTDPPLVGW